MDRSERLAGAPISWGICEVPGWGRMLPARRVLREMASLGLTATELGPPGFLPDDADELQSALDEHGLRVVGAFVPVVMHDAACTDRTRDVAGRAAALLSAIGADVLVSAAVVDNEWAPRRPLTDGEWHQLFRTLELLDQIATDHHLQHVLHPHLGTLVETADDIARVMAGGDVRWCLDTGHLAIGGSDPLEFAQRMGNRVGHVHLKDVDMAVAERMRSGELDLVTAVRHGLFRPLGQGDVPIDRVVGELERGGYQGWYVLEQDTAIMATVPAEGTGPVADVRVSLDYLSRTTTITPKGEHIR